MNRFRELESEMNQQLRDLLEAPIKSDDSTHTLMAKQFYRSCMDVEQLERLGVAPLKSFLAKYGGWPVVEGSTWDESKYDWVTNNARFATEVTSGDIMSIEPKADFKNSSRTILFIDQASLGLENREYYLNAENKKFLDAYFEYMVQTAVELDEGPQLRKFYVCAPKEKAEKEMKDVLEFETGQPFGYPNTRWSIHEPLANISIRNEDRRDNNALYRPMTIKELKDKYPSINFDAWFRTVSEAGWKLQDSDVINLSGQPYLERLAAVLSEFSKRTLANFQIWKLALDYADTLAPSLRENQRIFREATTGAAKFQPRWAECVGVVSGEMGVALGAMYVERYSSQQTKQELDNMVTNVRKAMGQTIEGITWMDSTTKVNAHKKLESMIQMIAFPSPDIYNETWVMREYTKANITADTFLENQLSLVASSLARMIREFRQPLNRTEWRGRIPIINAWYSPEYNTMTFPLGILQTAWYHPSAPDYYNYGHIGTVMGHELTHGFDDQGRQYDDKGNFNLWWSNETSDEFENGADCFVHQYGNITDDRVGLKLNGENTQGENIADNGGVKLAFKAFKASRKEDPSTFLLERNRILPRLSKYTAEQLFFLFYSQSWCNLIRPEALQDHIATNPHSPAKFRVNVPLQNNADFAQAFGCPLGSPMNPVKKCQIW